METGAPTLRYYAGLDLGQAADFTALAVLECSRLPDRERPEKLVSHYACRHLERMPLGTAYTKVCDRVVKLFNQPPLIWTTLAVDYTGVGRPVFDMLRKAGVKAALQPITITAGAASSRGEDGAHRVPKVVLVSTLQLLLQQRRLQVAAGLPAAATLTRELQQFQVKVTPAANEIYGAWREGAHDDLVLAVCCAAWIGENRKVSHCVIG